MAALRVTVTGASGLIGSSLVAALLERGAHVTILTRNPQRARPPGEHGRDRAARGTGTQGDRGQDGSSDAGQVEVVAWQPEREPAPAAALAGRDAVVHLAGEPVAQRWSARARRAIRDSRVTGTANLVAGIAAAASSPQSQPAPRVLVSGSAAGYYGPHGEEPLDEEAPPGGDFLAGVCVDWEAAAARAREHGLRVVQVRTGVVLAPGSGGGAGGALGKMLPPFKLGLGGPVAGGRQYISWIHASDLVGIVLAALEDERWSGPFNATAPDPVTNREFSKALGRVLGRPAFLPVPALALRALYGSMADIVIGGARVLPARALVLGYQFAYPQVEEALRAALA